MAEIAKRIRCEGANLTNGYAEGPNKFTILTGEDHDVKKLQIGFEGPADPKVKLVTRKDKKVDVTFTTVVGGEYQIHIKYDEEYVKGAPFKCLIVGDVKSSVDKITISGANKEAKGNVENEIIVDGGEVGICGGLTAKMDGPSPIKDLKWRQNEDGTATLFYTPEGSGNYKLEIKFLQFSLPGSPFTIVCA